MTDLPSLRDLIALEAFDQPRSAILSIRHPLAIASIGFSVLSILVTLPILAEPDWKAGILPFAFAFLAASQILALLWIMFIIVDVGMTMIKNRSFFADQIEDRMRGEQGVIDMLMANGSLADLQRYDRRLSFELKMIDQLKGAVAILAGLGAAAIALAPALPLGGLPIGDALKIAVPAILLGAGIAGIRLHDFGLRLHRVGFAFSEAERLLRIQQDAQLTRADDHATKGLSALRHRIARRLRNGR